MINPLFLKFFVPYNLNWLNNITFFFPKVNPERMMHVAITNEGEPIVYALKDVEVGKFDFNALGYNEKPNPCILSEGDDPEAEFQKALNDKRWKDLVDLLIFTNKDYNIMPIKIITLCQYTQSQRLLPLPME